MMGLTERIDAISKVTDNRGVDYGHPADDFRRCADIKKVLADCPDDRLRHALEMIAVKMVRLVHNPRHGDSWLDIAGYARCAAMVLDQYEGHAVKTGMQGNTEHD